MTGIRFLIPRSAVYRIATGALLAGCVLIGCVALAGCRVEAGEIPASMIPPQGPVSSAPTMPAKRPRRGSFEVIHPRPGVTCWAWKHDHGAALACLPDEPSHFGSDCRPPAEAPEVGRP